MMTLFPDLSTATLLIALGIALGAGLIKGVVGFAMPMVMISGLSTIMPPNLALAGLILPTLASNGYQALRQGQAAALGSVKKFRVFLLVGGAMILISSQLVTRISAQVFMLSLGTLVCAFAAMQLMGWRPSVAPEKRLRFDIGVGAVAGFIGGMSGIWGPPTVLYLTALRTEKREQVRVQGVIYGLGAVLLAVAHIGSGILNASTIWLSVLLLPAALLGTYAGSRVQDRIDQTLFRRATLVVLIVAGLNLVRRAVMGA